MSGRPALASNKILRTFEHYPNPLEFFHTKVLGTTGRHNALGALGADPRYPKQRGFRRRVDFHRERIRVAQRPAAFGIKVGVEVRGLRIQQFFRFKTIIPQQPICLIQPMFAQQRRRCGQRRQTRVWYNRQVGRIKHPLERIAPVQSFAQPQNLQICLR